MLGYYCTRSGGSLGLFDVVGIGTTDIVLGADEDSGLARYSRNAAVTKFSLPAERSPTDVQRSRRLKCFWRTRPGSVLSYSYRRAIIGSTFVAFTAGRYAATKATKARSTPTPPKDTGSPGLLPNKRADCSPKGIAVMTRAAAAAPNSPRSAPVAANAIVRVNTRRTIVRRCAPSAMRIPISRVR